MKFKKKEILAIFILIILDQVTKILATNYFKDGDITIIPNFFYLTYTENTGAAWSMLEGQMWFFYVITIAALGLFIWYLGKTKENAKLERISLTLMIAGTFGNFIDRIFLQYVRDFIGFYIFNYSFPIFNVADMELTIGAALLIISFLIPEKKHE